MRKFTLGRGYAPKQTDPVIHGPAGVLEQESDDKDEIPMPEPENSDTTHAVLQASPEKLPQKPWIWGQGIEPSQKIIDAYQKKKPQSGKTVPIEDLSEDSVSSKLGK